MIVMCISVIAFPDNTWSTYTHYTLVLHALIKKDFFWGGGGGGGKRYSKGGGGNGMMV